MSVNSLALKSVHLREGFGGGDRFVLDDAYDEEELATKMYYLIAHRIAMVETPDGRLIIVPSENIAGMEAIK